MAKLVCLGGMNKRDQFPLHEGKNVVGRADDCQIKLFDKKCSRQHCVIYKKDNHYSIMDLDSRNGTEVNEKKTPPQKAVPMKPGDIIHLGNTYCKLSERPLGGRVDQEATDVAAEMQGRKFDRLMENATKGFRKTSDREENTVTQVIRSFWPKRKK